MSEDKSTPKSNALPAEILQLWMDIYALARMKGLDEKKAKGFANAMTSPLRMQMWQDVYEISMRAGLSAKMAMRFANAATPLCEEEYAQLENLVQVNGG